MRKRIAVATARLVGYPAWVYLAFLVSGLVIGLLVRPLVQGLSSDALTVTIVIATALVYALALGIVLLVPRPPKGAAVATWRRTLGLERALRWSHLGRAMILYPAYFGTLLLAIILLQLFAPGLIDLEQTQETGYDPATFSVWYQYVLAFIGLVVLPPFFEELLFRGYLFGKLRAGLRGKVGFWVAALITSTLFGAVHGQWNVAIDTFILSLYLSYLREWSGSIWPAVTLHAIKNGVAYFMLFIAPLLGWQLLQ